MTSGVMQGYFEQFLGRIEPLYIPDQVFADECREICAAFNKRPSAELVALAQQVANEPGKLRVLFNLLKKAAALAKAKKEPLSAAHLRTAHDHRANRNRWPSK